jgi:DNA-directed RNA polymerase subunit K/omega
MNTELLNAALAVIPNRGILVNMVSIRVRQLSHGHKSLVPLLTQMGLADIALTEIGKGKLTYELTPGENGGNGLRDIEEPVNRLAVLKRAA